MSATGEERRQSFLAKLLASTVAIGLWATTPAVAQTPVRPNIVVIMGDDIGWFNIGAYHRGMMAGRTPNLDKLAAEGMLFTDYYAEASCTAGRANFITGQLPIRTGHDDGRPGGRHRRPAGRGPDHRHGAEVDGLRHRPVRQEPPRRPQRVPADGARLRRVLRLPLPPRRDGGSRAIPNYPQDLRTQVGPRNMLHCWATDDRRSDRSIRAGARSASRRSRTPASSAPSAWRRSTTRSAITRSKFVDKAKADDKPFFLLAQPDAHAHRHAPVGEVRGDAQRRERLVDPRSRHGAARRHRRRGDEEAQGHGRRRQHHRRLHHRQRHRDLHLAGRRPDAVRAGQGHRDGRRLPRAGIDPLAGQGAGRQGRERPHLRARLVPDLGRGGRQPEHRRGAEEGQEARRPHLQGPSRRLQPDGPDHRQGPVEAPRDLLLRRERRSVRSGSTTTSTASSISPAAGSARRPRPTCRS